MNLYSDYSLLESSLVALSGKSDNDRKRAAQEVKGHVEAAARELSLERFGNYEMSLFNTIITFVNSENVGEKVGGILAIRELIDCASASAEAKVIKFADTLAKALNVNTDFMLIELVADAFGHMARYSPVSHVDYIEAELGRSLEWLRGTVSHRRFAACAILQQFAENAPTIFFVKTKEFFQLIWDALWDPKEQIRLAAGRAFSACLALLSQRTYHLQWYCTMYDRIHDGLQKGTAESVHGSLLVVTEMFKHTGDFMVPRFKEISKAILQLKEHRSKVVKSAIIQLLPSLATFCPDAFARSHLDEATDITIKAFRAGELRQQALLSLGQLCRAVGSHLVNRVGELASIVRDAFLIGAKKNRAELVPGALRCVSDMVIGLGAPFHDLVLTLLEPMLQSGLTAELIDTLNVIGTYVPNQKPIVQQRLLDEATKILGGDAVLKVAKPAYLQSWSRKGRQKEDGDKSKSKGGRVVSLKSPVPVTAASTMSKRSSFNFFRSSTPRASVQSIGIGIGAIGMSIGLSPSTVMRAETMAGTPDSNDLVLLALRTLASMSLPPSSLLHLVEHSVLMYVNYPFSEVRIEAATTCASMLAGAPVKTRGPTATATLNVVHQLLSLVVTDPVSRVRLSVLRCLGSHFDILLCRESNLQTLLLLLSDESFEIRLEVLKLLGRLAPLNPAAVLPPLRLLLIRSIAEILNSADARLKEEASLLVCTFVRGAQVLHTVVRPFVSTLLSTLPLHGGDVRLVTASLEAVGELCLVMHQDILPFADRLMPVIIANMHDPASKKKQEMSVRTLGQLVSATGLAIRPYLQYPQLLPWILDLLGSSSTSPHSLRVEALRTLGLLGALEPRKYEVILSHVQDSDKTDGIEIVGAAREQGDSGSAAAGALSGRRSRGSSGSFDASFNGKLRSDSSSSADKAAGRLEELMQAQIVLEDDNAESPAHLIMYEQSAMRSLSEPPVAEVLRKLPSDEDYYPHVAINALMKILYDSSLQVYHSSVTQAIMLIFRSLGFRCVPFLDQIVPYLLQLVRKCGPGLRESLLQQLSQLVSIVQHHISPYLLPLFEIIHDYWNEHLEQVLFLVEEIASNGTDSFGAYVTTVLPLLLSSLVMPAEMKKVAEWKDSLEYLRPIEQTLSCCNSLRSTLQAYIHLIIPALCKLLAQMQECKAESVTWQTAILITIRRICSGSKGFLVEQCQMVVSRVVHAVVRTVALGLQEYALPGGCALFTECVRTLCALGNQMGQRFLTFDALICRVMENRGIDISLYKDLINEIHSGAQSEYGYSDLDLLDEYDSSDYGGDEKEESSIFSLVGLGGNFWKKSDSITTTSTPPIVAALAGGLPVNQQQLSRAWDVSQRSTAADWNEWLRRLNVDLLRESPSSVLRSCSALAQSYAPLARELFHAAFVSCWCELSDTYQESLVRALQTAFRSNTIPPEILQSLLNLAEFMEHDVEALPIPLSILADLAQKGHAYAKALHYRELEFQNNPASCFESLININKKLDQYDAAVGVLKVVSQMQKRYPQLVEAYRVQEAWLAKLGYWTEALDRYDQRLVADPRDSLAISGKLKCLDALGRWEEALKICGESLDHLRIESTALGNSNHTKAAVLCGRAAWALSEWGLMENIVSQLPENNVEGLFMKAVLGVHKGENEESCRVLAHTRQVLDVSITTLLAESYGRAYVPLIMVQQCSELEEIIEYRMLLKNSGMTLPDQPAAEPDWPRAVSPALAGPAGFEGSRSPGRDGGPSSPKSFSSSSFPKAPAGAYDVKFLTVPHSTSIPRRPHAIININSSAADRPDAPEGAVLGGEGDSLTSDLLSNINRRKNLLIEKWHKRIKGCCSSGKAAISVWKSLLNGRRMVLSEREDLDTWLAFASLCRNCGNSALADRVLKMVKAGAVPRELSEGEAQAMEKRIDLAILEQNWVVRDKLEALRSLEALTKSFGGGGGVGLGGFGIGGMRPDQSSDAAVHLACLLKLGEWRLVMIGPGNVVDAATRRDIISLYNRATAVDPHSYQAWHQWGLSNYRAIEEARGITAVAKAANPSFTSFGNIITPQKQSYKQSRSVIPGLNTVPSETIIPLATNATKGLLRAISLGNLRNSSSVMQDMLCILSLWFRYCKYQQVYSTLDSGLATVHLDNWLGVLPQLIARIDHHEPKAKKILHGMLVSLGTKHAQALVYPLSVALKSPKGARKEAAESLMASLRQHSTKLIDQALLVSQELVRVAILWPEIWHESLEEASRQYFGDGNVQAMLDTLLPLHEALEQGPSTLREVSFCQSYGQDLREACELLKTYKRLMTEKNEPVPVSGAAPSRKNKQQPQGPEEVALQQAWDLYYSIFKRINVELPQITQLELHYCSPNLLKARDLDLGVPGTYSVSGDAVKIHSFGQTIGIIRSKQRPRKLRIMGDNGQEFIFLLKGHEDLRQDERAMQLFGLVNALLHHDRQSGREFQDLSIQRYAVIPLSPTAGLISWVPNCDTFHDLIRDFRDSKKVMLNIEHKLMQTIAPNNLYDLLPHIQKLEVFEHAVSNTTGEDLAKILWLKSDTSEAWLQRRANYTRSMAVMSMVGYVLGLGDRHPSNLMLSRRTGKVLHIDFGDCFEVAMQRDKFPERVPFRLTRMLISAMEVSGIEGSYRFTCEEVMTVLRENRDSLIATLEAFVHDPLISWRLLNKSGKARTKGGPEYANKNSIAPAEAVAQQQPSTPPAAEDEPDSGRKSPRMGSPRMDPLLEEEAESVALAPADVPPPSPPAAGAAASAVAVPPKPPSAIPPSSKSFRTDLHLEMNSLANTVTSLRDSRLASHSFNQHSIRSMSLHHEHADTREQGELTEKAVIVIRRVMDKLTGLDFYDPKAPKQAALDIPEQVDRLIKQATANENLALSFFGWCPWW